MQAVTSAAVPFIALATTSHYMLANTMCADVSLLLVGDDEDDDEDEEPVESEADEESTTDDEMDEAQQVSKAKSMAAALKTSKSAQGFSIILSAARGCCVGLRLFSESPAACAIGSRSHVLSRQGRARKQCLEGRL